MRCGPHPSLPPRFARGKECLRSEPVQLLLRALLPPSKMGEGWDGGHLHAIREGMVTTPYHAQGSRTCALTPPTPSPTTGAVAALRDVTFAWNRQAPPVLHIRQLDIAPRERVFLRGPSGSGKTTLLNLLAGVVLPQRGSVSVLGTDFGSLGGAARDRFRADHVGFVFQLFNLIPYLTVVENVVLPCLFSKRRRERAIATSGSVDADALRLLQHLDMADPAVLARPATDLSAGQQQRVAAARALVGAPELVIADEATSALDADRRAAFLDLLFRECAAAGAAIVFVSHDASAAHAFDRTIELGSSSLPPAGARQHLGAARRR